MSKYAEAITTVDNLGVCDSCGDYDRSELNTTIIEALEIADRLEQSWEEVKDKEFPPSIFQNCRECGNYKRGRKDALADLRGDNND